MFYVYFTTFFKWTGLPEHFSQKWEEEGKKDARGPRLLLILYCKMILLMIKILPCPGAPPPLQSSVFGKTVTVCSCGVFFSGLDLLSEVYPGTAGIIKQPTIYSVAVSSALDMRKPYSWGPGNEAVERQPVFSRALHNKGYRQRRNVQIIVVRVIMGCRSPQRDPSTGTDV